MMAEKRSIKIHLIKPSTFYSDVIKILNITGTENNHETTVKK